MARTATATRGASTAPRARRKPKLTYRRLFVKLIGAKKTKELIENGRTELHVEWESKTSYLNPQRRDVHVFLAGHSMSGYCINPRITYGMKTEAAESNAKPLSTLRNDNTEYELSRLYPKVMLLLVDPEKFFNKAG